MKKLLSVLVLSALAFGCAHKEAKFEQQTQLASADNYWVESQDRELASKATDKCINRVLKAGCYLSGNDQDRITRNVDSCKQVRSGSGNTTLELFGLRGADKLVVFKTDGVNECRKIKYDLDPSSGIKEFKVIKNKVYFLTHSGRVFFMYTDESFHEILNSNYMSYNNVVDIKGIEGGTAVQLIFNNGTTFDIESDDLQRKIESGKTRKVNFWYHTTDRSLFRDE